MRFSYPVYTMHPVMYLLNFPAKAEAAGRKKASKNLMGSPWWLYFTAVFKLY